MYLIQYSPRDFSNYAVRAYDLGARRLLPEPVVDPREADEPMTGAPVTRVASADGRWAYTLYDSAPSTRSCTRWTPRAAPPSASTWTTFAAACGARRSSCAAPR